VGIPSLFYISYRKKKGKKKEDASRALAIGMYCVPSLFVSFFVSMCLELRDRTSGTTVHCCSLQNTTTHCNTLQHRYFVQCMHTNFQDARNPILLVDLTSYTPSWAGLRSRAIHSLPSTIHCNTLEYTATHQESSEPQAQAI